MLADYGQAEKSFRGPSEVRLGAWLTDVQYRPQGRHLGVLPSLGAMITGVDCEDFDNAQTHQKNADIAKKASETFSAT